MFSFCANIFSLPFKFCFNFIAVMIALPFVLLWLLKVDTAHFLSDAFVFAFDSIMDFDY